MRHVCCNLCGADDNVLLDAHKNDRYWPPDLEVRTVACRVCGLVYVTPQADAEDLEQLYGGDYAGTRAGPPSTMLLRRKRYDAERRIKLLLEHLDIEGRGRRVLEVGSGTGTLLALFQAHGWEVIGVEPTPSFVSFARSNFGLKIIEGFFDPDDFEAESFDVVLMGEVIEHLSDPAAVLEGTRRILKPGGTLFIDTPNVLRPNRVRLDRFFRGEHLVWFSPRTLRAMLEKTGFKVVAHEWHYYQYVVAERATPKTFQPAYGDNIDTVVASLHADVFKLTAYRSLKFVKAVVLKVFGERAGVAVLRTGARAKDRLLSRS